MITTTVLTFEQITQQKINNLVISKTTINQNYNNSIAKVQNDYNNGAISNDEKNTKITQLNNSRVADLNNIESEISTLATQLHNTTSNPYKNITTQNNNLTNNINSSLKDTSSYESQLKKEKILKIAGNATKSLVPVLASRITDQLTNIVSQNQKIEDLVDSTNVIITTATTQSDINKATTLRNSTINVINNNENKILSIKNTLNELNLFIEVFNVTINVLSSLPTPVGAPTGVGLPLKVIIKISKSIENANKLVLGLNTILAISVPILTRMISDLEAQKARLDNINGALDNTISNNTDLQDFVNSLSNTSSNLGGYKGFTFVLKEEANPGYVVDGYKRHYAVALNSQSVPVLQSDYSYTLDPQVLVDELKLNIDKLGLSS